MTDSMNIPELETLSYKPNKLTTQTLEKAERGEDVEEFDSAEELFKDLHEVSNAEELIKELNKPEQPASAPREAEEKTTLDIELKTKVENKESVGQPTEQPDCKRCKTYGEIRKCPEHREQPNQQLMLIQTIQGLMACVNDNFDKLCVLGSDTSERKTLIAKALEEIDLFEKTTLFDLQKEYE